MGAITITTYFSIQYLVILLPAVIILYAILPLALRRILLLTAGYLFFFAVSGALFVFMMLTTLSVYLLGLMLARLQERASAGIKNAAGEQKRLLKKKAARNKRLLVVIGILFNIGILVVLKYSPFFIGIFNDLMSSIGVTLRASAPSFVQPIGISFYTLQAAGYLIDVYREKISADRNILRLSLFLSFFPLIMEGPICRYSETAEALWEAPRIQYRNFVLGFQRIMYGLMKKMVVADRLNLLISNVFSDYQSYDGFVIALAAVCYTVQLYMDFSGTMDLAIGAGQIFGITVPENFRRPFFSRTVSEFWKRWHITLGAWFRDYIFYPVSVSKRMIKLNGRARKRFGSHFGKMPAFSVALFCVWVCNGLWHGAGWQYLFFGMYHYVLILGGNIMDPAAVFLTEKLHIKRSCPVYRWMQICRTGVLVVIGELFFRADSVETGIGMFRRIFTHFSLSALKNGSLLELGADGYDYCIVAVILVLILVIGIVNEKNISIREASYNRGVISSYAVSLTLVMITVVFGAYGDGYLPVDPIYAGF